MSFDILNSQKNSDLEIVESQTAKWGKPNPGSIKANSDESQNSKIPGSIKVKIAESLTHNDTRILIFAILVGLIFVQKACF